MTIREALKNYHDIEIELLLPHILKKPKEFLFMNPEYQISENQKIRLLKVIKRREKGEPIAYILGYKDFMGLRFKVNMDVLIPRPETEGLVEYAIKQIEDLRLKIKDKPIRVLDVGTGSGCIIISLAKILQTRAPLVLHKGRPCRLEFCASDISKKALRVATANAKKHQVKIKFIHSDILKNVGMSFGIIVANLPYGWKEWKNNTSAETQGLKFEPKHSLFTKEKGLFLIKRLLLQIAQKETKPKIIFLEIDPRQKKDFQRLIKKYLPAGDIKFYRDFNNLWRYAKISQ